MSDRLAEIRERLDALPADRPWSVLEISAFIPYVVPDIRYLLALLDSTTECGCPIARVRMHTDECKAGRR